MLKKYLCVLAFFAVACCAAPALDLKDIPNPLDTAEVGQWVSYKMPQGMEQKQTITNIQGAGNDRKITIKFEMLMGEMSLNSEEREFDYKEYQDARFEEVPDDVTITRGKVTSGGKEYDVLTIEFSADGDQSVKLHMSEAIPVTGMVKMELGAMGALLELADFKK